MFLSNNCTLVFTILFHNYSYVSKFLTLGPYINSPLYVYLEPWHGQSQVLSRLFQFNSHPKCMQIGLTLNNLP